VPEICLSGANRAIRIATFAGPSLVLGYTPTRSAGAVVVIDALIHRLVSFIDRIKVSNSGHDGFLSVSGGSEVSSNRLVKGQIKMSPRPFRPSLLKLDSNI
jgi:hypothetical protein